MSQGSIRDYFPKKDDTLTTQRRYVVLRIEYHGEPSDHAAIKLSDELIEFAGALGEVFVIDEGIGESIDPAAD